ncbi:XkdX family protein [Pediococcus pentosaceus]|nr:XkdX family protein [Pediococcus pentosaceus]
MRFPDFNAIKGYAGSGLWTNDMVAEAVKCGNITAEQYKEITGESYEETL